MDIPPRRRLKKGFDHTSDNTYEDNTLQDIVPHVFMLCLSGMLSLSAQAQAIVHQNLNVDLDPNTQTLAVRDTIEWPVLSNKQSSMVDFRLNAGLELSLEDTTIKIQTLDRTLGQGIRYRVCLPPEQRSLTLTYQGRIMGAHDAPVRKESITHRGTFLGQKDLWFPLLADPRLRFTLQVNLPAGWTAISQGARVENTMRSDGVTVTWTETNPQQDIYLVAGPYHEFHSTTPIAESMVFIRDDDPDLAKAYLEATQLYLGIYQQLLGAYPYAKFAMVENTEETGYGMPSFTLLGPRVIRLPFLLHTAYPHEILHNWWGNGVYVNYEQGNWSEGLTAYLADHLIQEQRGRGAQYRREALQKYANYVNDELDFPLTEFRGRHGDASQAIGYNKALMFFHMLRLRLGDATFLRGLRTFYRHNRFKSAGFSDLRKAFEETGQTDLGAMFEQWIERSGAPTLSLSEARVYAESADYILEFRLDQGESTPPYQLNIPLAITLGGKDEILEETVSMNGQSETVRLRLPSRPQHIHLDPRFDLFRRLHPLELPASLGQFFGAPSKILVLPSEAPLALKEGYRKLAQNWAQRDSRVEIRWDDQLDELPRGQTLWLLGWENRLLEDFLRTLAGQDVERQDHRLRLAGKYFERNRHSLVLTSRDKASARQAMVWLGTGHPSALVGLARKLPHYSKYSYLVFDGDEPSIVLKGHWPVLNSPLSKPLVSSPDYSQNPKLKPREPLMRFVSRGR